MRTVLTLLVCSLVFGAVPARAQGRVADPALERLLRQLDSPSLTERDSATLVLIESDSLDRRDLERALVDRDLTPEQRLRLGLAAQTRFNATPRAAIGIQLNVQGRPSVTETIPGFDAFAKLERGDEIRRIAGVPIEDMDDLRAVVISHDPGAEVVIELDRGGRPLAPVVALGAFRDLGQVRFSADELGRAWALRLTRLTGGDAQGEVPVVRAPVTADAWRGSDPTDRTKLLNAPPQGVTIGGEARPFPGDGLFAMDGLLGTDRATREAQFTTAVRDRVAALVAEAARVRRAVSIQTSSVARPDIPADRKRVIREALEQNERRLRVIDEQIARFESLIGRAG